METLLLNSFYTIKEMAREGDTITARIIIDGAHEIFKGHFPDMPVVPGVCQTHMLGEVLNLSLDKALQLRSASSIKFVSVVDPRKNPELTLTLRIDKESEAGLSVSAQYTDGAQVFFKFKGVYS